MTTRADGKVVIDAASRRLCEETLLEILGIRLGEAQLAARELGRVGLLSRAGDFDRVTRVSALHFARTYDKRCADCHRPWPCPTTLALR